MSASATLLNHPMVGRRFGMLVVIRESHVTRIPSGQKLRYWLCKCDCGNEKAVTHSNLTSGNVRSCRCLQKKLAGDRLFKHGMTRTPIWHVWQCMLRRCQDQKHEAYARYGGRGITVCR